MRTLVIGVPPSIDWVRRGRLRLVVPAGPIVKSPGMTKGLVWSQALPSRTECGGMPEGVDNQHAGAGGREGVKTGRHEGALGPVMGGTKSSPRKLSRR